MDEDEDKDSKTEEPTPRRLEEALKQGQVINSREVTSFILLAGLTLLVAWILPSSIYNTSIILKNLLVNISDVDISEGKLGILLKSIFFKILLYCGLPLSATMLLSIFASFLQQGQFNISSEPLMPKLSKISPLAGLGRLFSSKSLIEFLKGLAKIIVVGIVVYITIMSDLKEIRQYQEITSIGILTEIYKMIYDILFGVCIVMAIIAGLDYLYQRHEYYQNLRMSKKDIKDEHKQSEGSPEIKQKLRSIRLERAKNRMMSNVPKADVIITNPTHYSIALKYDIGNMAAPKIVAKGVDLVAMRIREIAKEYDVPLVENAPLARALYKLELDSEVPVEHYEAVAEIISYIFKVRK